MKNCCENFVGVIDSGVGGLTILNQLQQENPTCNFVYIADNAYCPYGTKQPHEILFRVETLIRYLQRNGVQSVVIACNTASVYARFLRRQFNLPIYDVIAPTCERVVGITKSKRVALLATNATVSSGVYQQKLAADGLTTIPFACSNFVPFVESGLIDTLDCSVAVDVALRNLPNCNVDAVILGCTHFPLLRKKIAPYACGATIVECSTNFRQSIDSSATQYGKTYFFTTGVEKQANNAAKLFDNVDFTHIDL